MTFLSFRSLYSRPFDIPPDSKIGQSDGATNEKKKYTCNSIFVKFFLVQEEIAVIVKAGERRSRLTNYTQFCPQSFSCRNDARGLFHPNAHCTRLQCKTSFYNKVTNSKRKQKLSHFLKLADNNGIRRGVTYIGGNNDKLAGNNVKLTLISQKSHKPYITFVCCSENLLLLAINLAVIV